MGVKETLVLVLPKYHETGVIALKHYYYPQLFRGLIISPNVSIPTGKASSNRSDDTRLQIAY